MTVTAESMTASRLIKVLSRLRDIHPDMNVQQALFLLHVAAFPGITQRQLWGILGTSDTVASRTLAILGPYGSRGTEPLKLIAIDLDPNDRRSRLLRLTPKGQRLIDDIHSDLTPRKGAA